MGRSSERGGVAASGSGEGEDESICQHEQAQSLDDLLQIAQPIQQIDGTLSREVAPPVNIEAAEIIQPASISGAAQIDKRVEASLDKIDQLANEINADDIDQKSNSIEILV